MERELLNTIESLFIVWKQGMDFAEDHHCEDGTRVALRDSDTRMIDRELFKLWDIITENKGDSQ